MANIKKADYNLMNASTVEEAKEALKEGANPNARDENKWSALSITCNIDIAKFLVEAGARVDETVIEAHNNEEIKNFLTACLDLINADTPEKAKEALEKGAYIDVRNASGYTPLMLTALRPGTNGKKEVVENHLSFLLDKGANPNAQSGRGSTAVLLSTTLRKAALLVSRGADLDIKNERGTSGRSYYEAQNRMTELNELVKEFSKDSRSSHESDSPRPLHNPLYQKPTEENRKEYWQARTEIQKKLLEAKNAEKIKEILNSDEVKRLVNNVPVKIDDIYDARGRTILLRALSPENESGRSIDYLERQIKLFIDCGANINKADSDGQTPLVAVFRNNRLSIEEKRELAQFLIEMGADANTFYKTPEFHSSDDVTTRTIKGAVVRRNTMELLQTLHQNPGFSDINKNIPFDWKVTDADGRTAVMLAAKNNNLKAIEKLFDAGAFEFISAKDKFGKTVFDYAENPEIRHYIQSTIERSNSKFLLAHTSGDLEDHLRKGADINAVNLIGQNALMLALERNDTDAVIYLLNKGIDLNAKDYYGRSALMFVQTKEQAKLLIEKGASTSARDNNGKTVFQHIQYYFLSRPHDAMYRELVEYMQGIQKLNDKLLNARTPDEVSAAIKDGADVNCVDDEGKTALMRASTPQMTACLLDKKADPNIKDNKGRTALMFAKDANQMKLLFAAGADILAKDNEGNSVFDYVKGNSKLETLLKDELTRLNMKDFIRRDEVKRQIEQYKRDHRRQTHKKPALSGTVVANKIAEKIISGEINGEVTPEKGKQISSKIIQEHMRQKKESNR